MARQIAWRVPRLLLTLLVASFLTFMFLSLLPGDPALLIVGADTNPEQIAAVRQELGLDRPLPVRYVTWLGHAATGNLGRSYIKHQNVSTAIFEKLPVTLEIGLLAIVFSLLIAIPLGTYTAYRANRLTDKVTTTVSFALRSVPAFVLALLFIYIFSVNLKLLPATGWTRITKDLGQNLRGAILPAGTLAIAEVTAYVRLLRSDMIATLQQDFVTMARAKGISNTRILFRHALRPSLFTLVTVLGLNLATIIGGALIVETIFALPGVGRLLVDSIGQRDYIMVQGVVLFIAASYVIINFLTDTFYAVIDPRIRHGRA